MSDKTKFLTASVFSFFALVAIAYQAFIYNKQWYAMHESIEETRKMVEQNERSVNAAERSAKAAEDSVTIAHRAYVLLAIARPQYHSDDLVEVTYEVINFGNTPATNLQIVSCAKLRGSEPERLNHESISWTVNEGTVIAPHYPLNRREEVIMSALERGLLNEKNLQVYLWGLIRYKDVFGNTHHTQFRLVHYPGLGDRFGFCTGGNEAD